MNKYEWRNWCYCIQRPNGDIKIGFTTHMINRLDLLRRQNGDIVVLGVFPGDEESEQKVHEQFSEHRLYVKGGWCGSARLITDYFKCTPQLLEWIEANTEEYEVPTGNIKPKRPMRNAARPFCKSITSMQARIYDEFELTIAAPARGLSADSEEAA